MKQLKTHWYYVDKDTSIFLCQSTLLLKNNKIPIKFISRDLKLKFIHAYYVGGSVQSVLEAGSYLDEYISRS